MNGPWNENRKKVARYLETYFETYKRSPSLDEIAGATGLWKRSVEIVLKGLEKIGFIEITPGISRGIRLTGGGEARVPLLGEVQAGIPAFAQEEAPEYIRIEKGLIPFDNPVALRVSGYSMRDAGIFPGDIVLLRQQQTADVGDTVVAWLNGGLTVKTFQRNAKQVILKPANPSYKAIAVKKDDEFHIQGKVMLVLRDLGDCFDFQIEQAEEALI